MPAIKVQSQNKRIRDKKSKKLKIIREIFPKIRMPAQAEKSMEPLSASQTLHDTNHGSSSPDNRSRSPPKYKNQRKTQFQPRQSRLDVETVFKEQFEFRGFFVLFWICAAVYMVNALVYNWRKDGQLFRLRLFKIFGIDLVMFGLSDLLMVSFTLICLPLIWLFRRPWMPFLVSHIIKHTVQACLVLGSVAFALYRDWPWPQTAVLCLHSVAMYMKMHSYLSYNLELEAALRRSKEIRKIFGPEETSGTTPDSPRDGLRRRRPSSGMADAPAPSPKLVRRMSSNERLDLEAELMELEKELVKGKTAYPANLTLFNFIDYLLVPTLVYELEYPRTEKLVLVITIPY